MMKPHKGWNGSLITDSEHEKCLEKLSCTQPVQRDWLNALVEGTDLYCRGRFHRNAKAPCVYVFRSQALASIRKGLVFHVQPIHNNPRLEIVFRTFESSVRPLPREEWKKLRKDSQQPNYSKWRAFWIENEEDIIEARRLVAACTETYDSLYG